MNTMTNGLLKTTEWIMRFSVVNLLWLTFNLPVVLLLLSAIYSDNLSMIMVFIVTVILSPFLVSPATAAMFAMVRDWILIKEQKSLIRSYWKHYRINYKQSFIGGFVLTIVWTVLIVDFYYFQQSNVILFFMFLLFVVVLYVYTIIFFSVLVHYNITLRQVFKNTLSLTLGSPMLFFAILLTSLVILYVSINSFLFLLLFFTASLIAFVSFSAFYRLYMRLVN
ncbi:hypothetical protein GCM10011351_01710 [Paraliobacillus quinghaiensis]|uniref:DUF624 domain-containing protein n=1 Tax=Paraliobacillus quinghaiensis TaxID=470815 RepID=A0A917TDJ2_9BACI|nr:DUF624 domain-containing protein [Paraliobacillus quinghaiensis]GGM19553.1 hypothetical protein GCM10011351_01710 [Paraliobacillus quinghaiensis]